MRRPSTARIRVIERGSDTLQGRNGPLAGGLFWKATFSARTTGGVFRGLSMRLESRYSSTSAEPMKPHQDHNPAKGASSSPHRREQTRVRCSFRYDFFT